MNEQMNSKQLEMGLRGKPDNTLTIKMTKDTPNTQLLKDFIRHMKSKLFQPNCTPNVRMRNVLTGLLKQNIPKYSIFHG